MNDGRQRRIRDLHRARPRSAFARISLLVAGLFVAVAWGAGEIDVGGLFEARRMDNVTRFLERDALPYPLREEGVSLAGLTSWASAILADRGLAATALTLWIAVLSTVLASAIATALAPFATRTLMETDPFAVRAGVARGLGWRLIAGALRVAFVLMRAIPEYVLAFLLLAVLGSSAWPAILALAIHNGGILGRLGAETMENVERAPARALASLGAGRAQIAWTALRPAAFPRFLLYVFYRFETCVREATVLGMLGVVSLGYWITEARARQHYDELLLFVVLGAVLVLAADLVSRAVRAWVRRA